MPLPFLVFREPDVFRLAGFQERFEIGQDFRPSAGDAARHRVVAFEPVMRDGQADEAGAVVRDVEGYARCFFRSVPAAPGSHQNARAVRPEHGSVYEDLAGIVAMSVFPARTFFPVGHIVVHPVAPGEFRLGDRVPDFFRRGVDVSDVNEWSAHGSSLSSFFLRSDSAASLPRSNLPIQRSAMSLIGTGLMKCSFSRPCFFVATRLASCRIPRCLVTAWRDISNPSHNSPNVCPFSLWSRSSNSRRLPSASARNTASMLMGLICNHLVACQVC